MASPDPGPVLLLLALSLTSSLAAEPVAQFRHSGTAVYERSLGDTWTSCWSTPSPSWSNATPVVVAGLVCSTFEPTSLWCLDAATGTERWRATNDFVDTLTDPAERARWTAELAKAPAREEEANALQRAYSLLRRQQRARPDDADLVRQIDETNGKLAVLRKRVDEDRVHLTPPDLEVIGYATHSPISDGTRIYAQFGHGVVSAFSPAGERLWSVWLGPAPRSMRGYHLGSAATPVLAGDTLVVGHDKLYGLDPATGAVRWTGPDFRDFATPAAAQIGSTWVVATNVGDLVRVSDGAVIAEELESLWYAGPSFIGDELYFVAGNSQHHASSSTPARATSYRLTETAPGEITVSRQWQTPVRSERSLFVSPTHDDEALYTYDAGAVLFRIDRATGEVHALPRAPVGPVYPSPLRFGEALLIGGENGAFARIDPTTGAATATYEVPMLRSTPVSHGTRLYIRALESLQCFETAP